MHEEAVTHLRYALALPRREWKFWAAVGVTLLLATVTISTVALIGDRNQWRDRFDQQTEETLCRSQASAGVNAANADLAGAHARITLTVDRALAALGRGDDAAMLDILDDLDDAGIEVEYAIALLDAAIDAQRTALEECQPQSPASPSTEVTEP